MALCLRMHLVIAVEPFGIDGLRKPAPAPLSSTWPAAVKAKIRSGNGAVDLTRSSPVFHIEPGARATGGIAFQPGYETMKRCAGGSNDLH